MLLPIEVVIRGLTGELHNVPEEWAVLLAQLLRNLAGENRESARSAADRIERRLTGAEEEPIEFEGAEVIEVRKALDLMGGWDTPDARALFWSLGGLPSYRPGGDFG